MDERVLFSSRELDFTERGKCAGMAPDLFFPPAGAAIPQEARDACAECDVRLPCLAWAIKHERYGFWGGATPEERRALRRRQR